MPTIIGPKEAQAQKDTRRTCGIDLDRYLQQETNRGVTDKALAKHFNVSRHTIRNWKKHAGLTTQRRALRIQGDPNK